MTSLKRLREPAAFVVLGVLALQLLVELIEFFVYGSEVYGSLSAAALAISGQMIETVTVVTLGLLVASCVVRDRTRHARLLVVLALVGTALMIAAPLALGLIGLAAPAPMKALQLIDLLVALVLPTLILIGLIILWRIQPAADRESLEQPAVVEPGTAGSEQLAPPSPEQEPGWQPDAASGVVWHTAGDAAVGAPAAGWGTPGETGGWDPLPDEAEGPQPPKSSETS